jgi:hypothetical protein
MSDAALVAGTAAAWIMVGVIWFVQIVHYPLLAVLRHDVSATSVEHRWRTTVVVAVPMAIQGISSLVLVMAAPTGVWAGWPWLGGALLAVALVVTATVSVPLHVRMTDTGDLTAARRLVTTNWWRTAAWTGHAVVMTVMAAQVLTRPG